MSQVNPSNFNPLNWGSKIQEGIAKLKAKLPDLRAPKTSKGKASVGSSGAENTKEGISQLGFKAKLSSWLSVGKKQEPTENANLHEGEGVVKGSWTHKGKEEITRGFVVDAKVKMLTGFPKSEKPVQSFTVNTLQSDSRNKKWIGEEIERRMGGKEGVGQRGEEVAEMSDAIIAKLKEMKEQKQLPEHGSVDVGGMIEHLLKSPKEETPATPQAPSKAPQTPEGAKVTSGEKPTHFMLYAAMPDYSIKEAIGKEVEKRIQGKEIQGNKTAVPSGIALEVFNKFKTEQQNNQFGYIDLNKTVDEVIEKHISQIASEASKPEEPASLKETSHETVVAPQVSTKAPELKAIMPENEYENDPLKKEIIDIVDGSPTLTSRFEPAYLALYDVLSPTTTERLNRLREVIKREKPLYNLFKEALDEKFPAPSRSDLPKMIETLKEVAQANPKK